jgi:hypothetical protein
MMELKIGFIVIKAMLEGMTQYATKGSVDLFLNSISLPKLWASSCYMPRVGGNRHCQLSVDMYSRAQKVLSPGAHPLFPNFAITCHSSYSLLGTVS